MRQDYYSKFQFVELGHPIPNNWYFDDKKILTVKMLDLYDYVKI